jgi:hypothetical protein
MPHMAHFFALILVLHINIVRVGAHEAPEDVKGCHFEEAQHHCHDTDADVGEFFAVLSIAGILAYLFCDRLIDCRDPADADIPEVPLPEPDVR